MHKQDRFLSVLLSFILLVCAFVILPLCTPMLCIALCVTLLGVLKETERLREKTAKRQKALLFCYDLKAM